MIESKQGRFLASVVSRRALCPALPRGAFFEKRKKRETPQGCCARIGIGSPISPLDTLLCPCFPSHLPCCALNFLRTYPAVPLFFYAPLPSEFEAIYNSKF